MTINSGIREKLSRLGIRNTLDLILHLPIRYEDETCLFPIGDLLPGQTAQIEGTITHNEVIMRPRRQLLCQVEDSSGSLVMRFLHFYASQIKTYAVGKRVRLLGEVRNGFLGVEMVHPKCRIVQQQGEVLANALTPIYATTVGLSQKILGKLIAQALRDVEQSRILIETLPEFVIKKHDLIGLWQSILTLHYPPPDVSLEALYSHSHPAWRRIKFDELLAHQLSMRLHYRKRRSNSAPVLLGKNHLLPQFIEGLPFALTSAQRKVIAEISQDLSVAYPMHRMLQGDVGSGKTIVAAVAALQAIENDYQVAIMAPTEILAEQHFEKLSAWLVPFGIHVVRLSGSQNKKQKQKVLDEIAQKAGLLVVGTHALFQDRIVFCQLGLVIIDEQHRFGVQQRLALQLKGTQSNAVPHQLMMTATPIPRTLSMSYYADLDVSIIDQLPPGRAPLVTKLIADNRRGEIIERIQYVCQQGKQAYWVCPLIEESEALQLQTALETYNNLSKLLPEFTIGLVHGRLSSQEKNEVVNAFKQGCIQLLVATTVIEVGVDIPNASLMVIENAERMGLSQLHQLRGRVGRGSETSICILMYRQPLSKIARERLKIIFETTDGFEIARQDLHLRGPGEYLGARQSGMPMLRFADLEQDYDLLIAVQSVVDELLNHYPDLAEKHIDRWLGDRMAFLRV
jgi:ATP-dependent DNA helicase RecG